MNIEWSKIPNDNNFNLCDKFAYLLSQYNFRHEVLYTIYNICFKGSEMVPHQTYQKGIPTVALRSCSIYVSLTGIFGKVSMYWKRIFRIKSCQLNIDLTSKVNKMI